MGAAEQTTVAGEYFFAHKHVTIFSLVRFIDFGCEFIVERNWAERPTLFILDSDSSLLFFIPVKKRSLKSSVELIPLEKSELYSTEGSQQLEGKISVTLDH